jgi:5-methylcytosine-specific restriction enzyme subunit McrC
MLIKTQEHCNFNELFCFLPKFEPKKITNKAKGGEFCGLYYDFFTGEKQLKTSYFIGACWLAENKLALQVEPKIQNLDYLTMFLKCFEYPKVSRELSTIYRIDFNQPKIELASDDFAITPLLIIHFLQVVKAIARKGLKKNYYPVEQNLNAKIKGKININKTLKHNIFKAQNHKTICNYQAFGIDCLENRLLKKALKFVQSYLLQTNIETNNNLTQTLAYCLAPFELVSDEIDIHSLKILKNNAFFKEYSEALKLAKMILKNFSYNLKNTQTKELTPPFWIDMSLLFEKYIYTLLLDDNQVEYQVKGNYGTVDFLMDNLIIDAKYKPKYANRKKDDYVYKIEDIRQLSGYGRDEKIRKKLNLNEKIAKCLIIYPLKNGKNKLVNLWNEAETITQFKDFKKIGVELPIKSADENQNLD